MKEVWIFTTTSCLPCQQLKMHIHSVPGLASSVKYINIEVDMELANKYGIQKVPTILFLKDGKPQDSFSGYVAGYIKKIQHFLLEENNV